MTTISHKSSPSSSDYVKAAPEAVHNRRGFISASKGACRPMGKSRREFLLKGVATVVLGSTTRLRPANATDTDGKDDPSEFLTFLHNSP
jgi:hypothetical protein